MSDVEALQRRFRIAATDQRRRSPFNAGLLASIAERPEVASLLQSAPVEQQLPVLLLAAVHSLVLADPDLELADWYPTVRDDPRRDDPFPAFARLCAAREAELREIVRTHSTQTNEVGRCALFLPVLAALSERHGPLALVDVGTSAGLNLLLDRYAYDYDGARVGGPSPVVLPCGVRGDVPIPTGIPPITGRVGLDREPIAASDEERVRWLMACVWPDQHDRFERLRGALALARETPPPVLTGDAVTDLPRALARVDGTGYPVVLTSWVLNYLPADDRSAFVAALDDAAAERDGAWIALESPGLCPGLPVPPEIERSFLTHLLLVEWRAGRRSVTHLAECHPHGYWMHWSPP